MMDLVRGLDLQRQGLFGLLDSLLIVGAGRLQHAGNFALKISCRRKLGSERRGGAGTLDFLPARGKFEGGRLPVCLDNVLPFCHVLCGLLIPTWPQTKHVTV